jgi:hypothetical protein
MTASRRGIGNVLIFLAILAVLVLLAFLFLRPPQPARDFVFGELGRHASSLTNRTESTFPPPVIASTNTDTMIPTNATAALTPTPAPPLSAAFPPFSQTSNEAFPPPSQISNDSLSNAVARAMAVPPLVRRSVEPFPADATGTPIPHQTPGLVPFMRGYLPPLAPVPQRGPSNRIAAASYEPPPNPDPDTKPSTAELLATTKGYTAPALVDNPSKSTAELLGVDLDKAKNSNSPAVAASHISLPLRTRTTAIQTNVSFLIDQSLSMRRDGKSERARRELLNLLENLGPNNTFYILFFHSGGYEGMPGLGPLPATSENISSVTNWIFSVGHRFGSDPGRAIRRALEIVPAPQVICVFSDGGFSANAVEEIRKANETANARINTVVLYDANGAAVMRKIAAENGGTFQFIPAP